MSPGPEFRPAVDAQPAVRPRLNPDLPVLRRSGQELQIGLEPEHGLILTAAPAEVDGLMALLARMDGRRTWLDLRADATHAGVSAPVLDRVIGALGGSGLLSEAGATTPTTVRVVGAGPLGRAVAYGLFAAGIGPLELSDPGAVDPLLYPTQTLAESRAQALRQELLDLSPPTFESAPTEIRLGPHWSRTPAGPRPRTSNGGRPTARPTEGAAPRITVLAGDTTEVDRAISDALLRADQPHLLVRPWLGGVAVGPLVVPGASPCLSCLDLTRTALDPAWPRLLSQLVRRTDRSSAASTAWAASTVVVQLSSWLADGEAELIGSTVELRPPDHRLRIRRWRTHPGCGCSWPVTARWGA